MWLIKKLPRDLHAYFPPQDLEQGLANHGLRAKFGPLTDFVNKVLYRHTLVYIVFGYFQVQGQS